MESSQLLKEVKGSFVKEGGNIKSTQNEVDYSHKGESAIVTLLGEKKLLVELYRTPSFTCCQVNDAC